MKRQLIDREEEYTAESVGTCSCGRDVIKVYGSSVSGWTDKTRYYYPGDVTAWNVFRCDRCLKPIQETFLSNF